MVNIEKEVLKLLTGIEIKVSSKGVLTFISVPRSYTLSELVLPDFIKSIDINEDSQYINTSSLRRIVFPKELDKCYFECGFGGSPDSLVFGTVKSLDGIGLYNTSLKDVRFDSIDSIERLSFAECDGLEDFDFSKVNSSIKEGAFTNCTSLNSLKNIDKCKKVSFGETCFQGCINLDYLHLSGNCSFAYRCFFNCTRIKEIVVDEEVVLGSRCFDNCCNAERILIKNFNSIRGKIDIADSCYNANIEVYNAKRTSRDEVIKALGASYASLTVHEEKYKCGF